MWGDSADMYHKRRFRSPVSIRASGWQWNRSGESMIVFRSIWIAAGIIILGFFSSVADAGGHPPYKVLVVMSYHEAYSWGREIREGIDSALGDVTTEVRYEYLDAKNNISGGAEQARRIYGVYRDLKPDGVIAADDAAQSLFVVPYLKDKVKTPVMFCGVNEDPEVYGYPAGNVSGILERGHYAESISFLQQLVPSVKTFCIMAKNDDTSHGDIRQVRRGAASYSARLVASRFPRTFPEAIAAIEEIRAGCDALLITPLEGLHAADGSSLASREVIPALVKAFGKPTFSGISHELRFGVLCSVMKTGQEQGATAGRMLIKAMRGKPVSEIPMTVNREGKRVLNVSEMRRIGVKPRPIVLRGVELITSEE
jgi:ABC-type uncharacterized transport system substrate-binding protein